MKYISCWSLSVLVLSLLPFPGGTATAADDPTYRYVRSDAPAGGNGMTWTTAFAVLPDDLTRGYTYYMAAGSYPRYMFDDPPSGETFIYVRKATETNHGTDTGWNNTYGEGPAVFSTLTGNILDIRTSYYEIDGETGGRPDSWTSTTLSNGSWINAWTSGHGFKIQANLNNTYAICLGVSTNPPTKAPDHIVLKHVDIGGVSVDDRACFGLYQMAMTEEGMGSRYIHISHCYVHDTKRTPFFAMYGQYWVIEYNYICRNYDDPASHGAPFADRGSDDMIVRYNIWADITGTGVLDLKKNETQVHENWRVYGNIIFLSDGNPYGQLVQSAGITGVTVSGLTSTTFAFHHNDGAADTITDSDNGFIKDPPDLRSLFEVGRKLKVQGSLHNDGYYTIAGITSSTLTLSPEDTLVEEPAGALVILGTGYTRNVKVYNNTIVNLQGLNTGVFMHLAEGCEVYNNLWYNCAWAGMDNVTAGYNTYLDTAIRYGSTAQPHDVLGTGDPFRGWTHGDFRLKSPLPDSKTDLQGDSMYQVDMLGVTRGTDGTWDRGALEFFDADPPSPPSNLGATPISSSQINLTWTASTDNNGVAGYRIFRDNTAVTTVTATSHEDKGLSASTVYTYAVSAFDAAGNESAQSVAVSTRTLVYVPQSEEISITNAAVWEGNSGTTLAVFSLSLNVPSPQEIRVDYATADGTATVANNDYVGFSSTLVFPPDTAEITLPVVVKGDLVEEPSETFVVNLSNAVGGQIKAAQATGTIRNDDPTRETGLMGYWKFDEISGTQAADSSGQGNTGTLQNGPAWASGRLDGSLSFDGVDDAVNVGQSGFGLEAGATIALWLCPTGTATVYQTLLVRGLVNPFLLQISKTTGQIRAGIRTTGGTSYLLSQTTLSSDQWYHVALTYKSGERVLYINGTSDIADAQTGNLPASTNSTTLGSNGSGEFFKGRLDEVRIYNRPLSSAEVKALFDGGGVATDSQAPTVPANLMASPISSSAVDLSWTASSDNVAVAGYRIFRNGSFCYAVHATSFRDSGLSPQTQYSYTVSAYDTAGNESGSSAPALVTTPAKSDTQAPTAPGSLSALSVSGSQISLSWSASTDNVGVVGYRVYRSQTSGEPKTLLTATPVAGLMYTDSGLASGTTYFYVVKAIDAESNQSAASPEASATTADTVPPAAPGNVKARPL